MVETVKETRDSGDTGVSANWRRNSIKYLIKTLNCIICMQGKPISMTKVGSLWR